MPALGPRWNAAALASPIPDEPNRLARDALAVPGEVGNRPVLLCYDGSPSAKDALAEAGRLLAPAPALLLHVWLPISRVLMWSPAFGTAGPLAAPAAELDDAWRAGAQRLLEEGVALAREAGFAVEPLLVETRHGAWRTIVALGEERHARLIVTGSHGISPAASRLLGSVAAGVVHHAGRPVLVVPARHPA